MYKYAIGVMAVCCLICCKTQQLKGKEPATVAPGNSTTAADDTVSGKTVATRNGKNVLSVILRVSGSTAGPLWRIDKVTVSGGYVKPGSQARRPGYMTAYFIDERGKRVDSAFFESPLERHVEYPADDKGKLTTTVRLNEDGAAYVRANYKETIKDLQLYNAKGKWEATLHIQDHIK